MQLYKINEQLERLINDGALFVDTETGEVFDDKALDELAIDWDTKVTNTGCLIKNMEADAIAMKNEIDALKGRRERLEKRIDSLKKYLSFCLEGKKFHSPQVDISFRKSEQVEADIARLPAEYIISVTTSKPNKIKLKEALKRNISIEGAALIEKKNIQIK